MIIRCQCTHFTCAVILWYKIISVCWRQREDKYPHLHKLFTSCCFLVCFGVHRPLISIRCTCRCISYHRFIMAAKALCKNNFKFLIECAQRHLCKINCNQWFVHDSWLHHVLASFHTNGSWKLNSNHLYCEIKCDLINF